MKRRAMTFTGPAGAPARTADPKSATVPPCPCGHPGGYARCCGPLHAGAAAATAEALMRSRYSAYVLGREDYLLATWHPSTRPDASLLAAQHPVPTWLGLDVHAHRIIDDDHAIVEFVARYRLGGDPARRLQETSRFVREAQRWYYVDGEKWGQSALSAREAGESIGPSAESAL